MNFERMQRAEAASGNGDGGVPETVPRSDFRAPPSTVLAVDDEKSIRLTTAEFLREAGYEVLLAADAAEAETHFVSRDVDVAVVDILLGHDNGLAVAQNIRACRPNTQIILATGEPEVKSARETIHLIGMRERAAMVGGTVAVQSKPGEGTTVRVRMPLARGAP